MKKIDLILELKKSGYKQSINDSHAFYKYTDNMINCLYNDKAPVIQVKLWDFEIESASVNVRGQIKDGYWTIIDFYSVTFNELLNNLENIENKLAIAWNSIAGE